MDHGHEQDQGKLLKKSTACAWKTIKEKCVRYFLRNEQQSLFEGTTKHRAYMMVNNIMMAAAIVVKAAANIEGPMRINANLVRSPLGTSPGK